MSRRTRKTRLAAQSISRQARKSLMNCGIHNPETPMDSLESCSRQVHHASPYDRYLGPRIREPMEISVVLATYNRAASLSAALHSFSKLVIPADLDWELLVVDNNSTDRTRTVIEEFQRCSGLQVAYLFEGQQGRSFALNAGIKRAKGGVIAFTDDDISLHPQWLANLHDVFVETRCSAV